MKIKRVLHKFNSHQEAEAWNRKQYTGMTPEQRQDIALELRKRAYGENTPDVRQEHRGS